jgi:uncharacterized protein
MIYRRSFNSCLLGLLLAGCTTSPPIKHYVLEAVQLNPLPQAESKQLAIGVGPVSIPSLLDRKKIVTRQNGNAVQIAEFNQWAEPLQDNIAETLRQDLSRLQPAHLYRTYPWSVHGTTDLQIIVDVGRFDAIPGETACLEANWTLKNEKSQKVLKSGQSQLKVALPDPEMASTVRGLSLLLGQLSQELALAILKFEPGNAD